MEFNSEQKKALLTRMGYQGPADEASMQKFMQSNPAVAAKMGQFQKALTRGFSQGGTVVGQTDFTGQQISLNFPNNTTITVNPDGTITSNNPNADVSYIDRMKREAAKQRGVNFVPNTVTNDNAGPTTPTYSNPGETMDSAPETGASTGSIDVGNAERMNIIQAFQQTLQRNPTQTEIDNYLNKVSSGTDIADVMNEIASSDEAVQNQMNLFNQQQNLVEGQRNLVTGAMTDPTSVTTQQDVATIQATPENQIATGTGQLPQQAPSITPTTVGTPELASAPQVSPASTYNASVADVGSFQGAKGSVTKGVQGFTPQVVQGSLSGGAQAQGQTMAAGRIQQAETPNLSVGQSQLAKAQGQEEVAPQAQAAQSAGIDPAVAAQATVQPEELPEPAQIAESEMAQADIISSNSQLSQDATAVAAKLDKFSVDNETLAKAVTGDVTALDTVQGQLASLMKDFDDGTPAWAAGAMRAANAAMQARGLGGSSMAAAAIVQASMESALPIASQDAQAFMQMKLTNLDRRQQVALANAAAQQGVELANFNAEQQAALQNSMNSFNLQQQDLSNMQQAMIANAQIKASLQGQNLNNRQQSNMAIAARYAELANINLNNRQQTALQNNANAMQTDLANLSNRQQAYLANAQLQAALQGQQIDNRQQAAMQNAARFSEAANIQFNADQQTQLHNSQLMATIGLAELSSRQAATLQNAAQVAAMDIENVRAQQQAAIAGAQNATEASIQNARNFLQMDLANVSNEQQAALISFQSRANAMLSNQAAENAAKQFNASSENQVNQFNASLQENISRFNASQINTMKMADADTENAAKQFNANLQNMRDQFNAQNSLIIAQANAQWRQTIDTTNTAAQNAANRDSAMTANQMTASALDQLWQRERDLMAFAFTGSESEKDRDIQMLLADKEADLVKWQQDKQEDQAKGYVLTRLAGNLLFGSGGGGLFG